MKRILSALLATSLTALTATAQVATSDAAWCEVIERVLSDHGVQANVRSDLNGSQKVLHVNVGNSTNRYTIPHTVGREDYSSPVYVIVEGLSQQGGVSFGIGNMARNNGRMWMGSRSSMYMPDEVFSHPADYDELQMAIRTAVSNAPRMALVDRAFTQQAINSGAHLLVLRGNIITVQRGEKFKQGQPNQRQMTQPNQRRGSQPAVAIERAMAYAKVHVELTDYRTGEVVWLSDLSKEDYTTSSYTDPMENVVRNIASSVSSKLASLYPATAPRASVYGSVLSTASFKKDKAQTVHINLGSAHELYKGDTFTVYESISIGNNSGATPIGTISVEEVQGATLSLCKVKKGNQEILSALQAGKTLTVRSSW